MSPADRFCCSEWWRRRRRSRGNGRESGLSVFVCVCVCSCTVKRNVFNQFTQWLVLLLSLNSSPTRYQVLTIAKRFRKTRHVIYYLLALKYWTCVKGLCRKSYFHAMLLNWYRTAWTAVMQLLCCYCGKLVPQRVLCVDSPEWDYTLSWCVGSNLSSWWCWPPLLSLLSLLLRSSETGARGQNLSSAETSKHRWVTCESEQTNGSGVFSWGKWKNIFVLR